MRQNRKRIFIILGALIVIGVLTNFTFYSNQSKSTPPLISLSNLADFYYTDYSYDISILSEYKSNGEDILKSISVYRYSSAGEGMLLQDSILVNKEGKPILKITPRESDFAKTNYFYDEHGNNYLNITIESNKYDTIYTLKKYDKFNHVSKCIQYNITRKELQDFYTIEISPISDNEVKLKLVKFDTDINTKEPLPFESRDMEIKKTKDTLVEVSTNRIVQNDTTYNSTYDYFYKIENNALVLTNLKTQFKYDKQGNWIEKKNNYFNIQRSFSYYTKDENEITNTLQIDKSVLNFLYSQMDSLPSIAWKNYTANLNANKIRTEIYENGTYGDSISLKQANSIDAFLPTLWYQVCLDSGYVTGYKNMCYVAGYNTPVNGSDGYKKRCLAIYEKQNGKYYLVLQSFGAMEDFYDSDENLLFNGYDEINCNVSIQDKNIIIRYEYMRGESSYEFTNKNGNWILESYSSGHRTCCQAENSSYDYRTKTYSYSIFNTGDDNGESNGLSGDTTVTEIQERPIMYMDSLNIRDYDFNETGILIK